MVKNLTERNIFLYSGYRPVEIHNGAGKKGLLHSRRERFSGMTPKLDVGIRSQAYLLFSVFDFEALDVISEFPVGDTDIRVLYRIFMSKINSLRRSAIDPEKGKQWRMIFQRIKVSSKDLTVEQKDVLERCGFFPQGNFYEFDLVGDSTSMQTIRKTKHHLFGGA